MRLKTTTVLLATAAAGGVFLINGGATAAQPASATGGGQTMVGQDGGPGNTIAFTARGTAAEGAGQLQYVARSGAGRPDEVRHGVVTCIDATGASADGSSPAHASIAGYWNDDNTPFQLYVEDGGEGASSAGDIVTLIEDADNDTCDFDKPDETTQLMRGNAQVRAAG